VFRVFPVLAGVVCLAVGFFVLSHSADEGRLRAAVAELDRTDPSWRLEELEEARAPVADDENGALVVLRAAALMVKSDGSSPLDDVLARAEPPGHLPDEIVPVLDQHLSRQRLALTDARKLAAFSTGRFPITYSADGYTTQVPHLNAVRAVESLLARDARLRAHEGEMAGALHAVRSQAAAGRCLGDEPLTLSQFLRGAVVCRAVGTAELVLSQGEGGEEELLGLQRILEEELGHRGGVIAARADRALGDRFLTGIGSGAFTYLEVTCPGRAPTVREQLQAGSDRHNAPGDHVRFLKAMTERIERAKVPFAERPGPFHDPQGLWFGGDCCRSAGEFALESAWPDDAKFQLNQAQLTCGVVLVAAERFRLARRRWPAAVEELVLGYLAEVPPDPYHGKPIRLRRDEDGLVVYSVGPDGADDGGQVKAEFGRPGTPDVGFRLWDVDRRRQPPVLRPPPGLPSSE
jgi:hypothetical protein